LETWDAFAPFSGKTAHPLLAEEAGFLDACTVEDDRAEGWVLSLPQLVVVGPVCFI